ncbi:ATP-dependent zinc metalloprotease FtsH [Eubacteriales bacterium OttesenSCG-928-M02]|nr:ATP-dependent zinc metalloprotease FtsH [Eubacteriales bacterium OttesenSCG-928-M02]
MIIFLIFRGINPLMSESKELSYNEFIEAISKGEIGQINIVENDAVALKTESSIAVKDFPGKYDYEAYVPSLEIFNEDLKRMETEVEGFVRPNIKFNPKPEPNWFLSSLPYLLISLAMIGFFWYMLSQQGQGGGKVMNFGKSRARMAGVDEKNKKTFLDVAGADEEKEELREIVDFLKNPAKFTTLGARIPKGVLLVGPPGTGKTLLAKAVAGEAGVPFYSISGSDFVEMFVGVGASRVRDLFENAKKNAPCIVFIDEIDAVGRHRGAGMGGGHDEREQTLNQLLVEMDGFSINEGIIILAATNRPDILDPALLRPGRFDRQVTVNYPDVKGREEILKVHARGKPLAADVDLGVVARRTPYFTGADLENVLNEAAILSARKNDKEVHMTEVLLAISRVQMGPEKKSAVVTENDKKVVSYHEAGHAIVAHYLPNIDPVHEVSIIPTGKGAGGYTMTLPGEETKYITKNKLLDQITFGMGGRAAEDIVLNEISTGASQDLKQSTSIARSMIVEYGMSDAIGNVYLGDGGEVFLGRDYGHTTSYSDEVAAAIDKEVKGMMDTAYQQAIDILNDHRDQLDAVAEALVEREKISGDEFRAIVDPKELPPEPEDPTDGGGLKNTLGELFGGMGGGAPEPV